MEIRGTRPLAGAAARGGTLRERRRLRNEARIRAVAGGVGPLADPRIGCECADRRCREQVAVPLAHYESIRRRGEEFFFVAPGHAGPDRVALYADRFFVVVAERDERWRDLREAG